MSQRPHCFSLFMICCCVFLLSVEQTHAQILSVENGGFEKIDTQRNLPHAWGIYFWGKAEKNPDAMKFSNQIHFQGKNSCMVQAVQQGAQGFVSRLIVIPAKGSYLQCSVRVKTSEDYKGNSPVPFLSWHDEKGKFLGRSILKNKLEPQADFVKMIGVIKRQKIPAQATRFAINLSTNRSGNLPASGWLSFDDVMAQMTDKPLVMPSSASRRIVPFDNDDWMKPTTDLSWWLLGQTVSYQANTQKIPDKLSELQGTIFNLDNKQIQQVTLDRQTLLDQGWSWKPKQPGLYEVQFRWRAQDQKAYKPLVRRYTLKAAKGKREVFDVPRWSFAVVASATPVMAQRNEQFGISIQHDGADIEIANTIGMQFARIHAIGWGAQFSNESLAIEPKPGQYDWKRIDAIMAHLKQYRFQVMGNLLYTPRWASPHPEQDHVTICVRDFSAYAPVEIKHWSNFVEACVKRYGDVINIWELWNEPNIPGYSAFWKDTPKNYYRLLKAGYEAVKKNQPQGTVCIGGLGPRTSYFAFYNQLLKLGGGDYFDVLALHGSNVTTQPFYKLDKAYGQTPKPWMSTEWHAMLYSAASRESANPPTEKQVTRKMFIDLMQQLKAGVQKIIVFPATGNIDREALDYARKNNWFAHWSGLFRTRPSKEPRLAAIVLQHFFSISQKTLTYQAGFEFNHQQQAAWFDQANHPLMILWSNADEPEPIDDRIRQLLTTDSMITQWDGKAVNMQKSSFAVMPDTIYFIQNINRQHAQKLPASKNVLINPREINNEIQQQVAGVLAPRMLFKNIKSAISAQTPWQVGPMQYINLDGSSQRQNFDARFAVGITPEYLDVAVAVTDPTFVSVPRKQGFWNGDSIQFAIDPDGTATPGNQIEFVAALDQGKPILLKTLTPYLGGDLPSNYTSANEPVKYAQIVIERPDAKTLIYKIRIHATELFPFALNPSKPLRFSMLVNNNDGHGRRGYLQWASGIGESKNPAHYGTLKPMR